jgi:RNA polymerase primary sigma factor
MNATIDEPAASDNRFAANVIDQDSINTSSAETQTLSFSKSTRRTVPADTMQRNCIKHYLGEIGKIPLLTREQEVTLASLIKKGDLAARELMIKSNLRLVVKIAYDYKNFGLPVMDLISEGNIGLIKAVERFDPEKGGKLSTYAAWWIKQSIKRALVNQSKTIRLPIHLVDKISKIRKIAAQLTEELGREPSDEELSEILEMPVNKIAHLKSVSVRPASLNAPIGAEGDMTEFGEIVGDEKAISPYQLLSEKSLRNDLSELIEDLEDRESSIIKMRFGIETDSPLTLGEIGKIFGITRERVRQVQNIALFKLRSIMSGNERQLTLEEVEQANRKRARMKTLREYYEKTANIHAG